MVSDEILEQYQKIVNQFVVGKYDPSKVSVFLDTIDIIINHYAEITDLYRRDSKRWDDRTQKLCEQRDIVLKIKAKGESYGPQN